MPLPTLETLETPAALVDVARVDANLRRVADYTRAHGLSWRPHTKTHKTAELALRQLASGASGVTVATPLEAEVMSRVADDIFLAYPPLGTGRLARLMALPSRVRLSVALDSHEALAQLSRAARDAGRTVGVLVELDLGMRRVGVQTPEEAVALARAIREAASVTYRGITFYPGHI
ncbi:MAG: alanine racemase, partial [Myxococcaceae bacterium]|nr:alanine racemase [Myxococcaceae bacterium]